MLEWADSRHLWFTDVISRQLYIAGVCKGIYNFKLIFKVIMTF